MKELLKKERGLEEVWDRELVKQLEEAIKDKNQEQAEE
jgi:hypothetical protein